MLVVTTAMGMLDRVHCHTSDVGPVLSLGLGSMVGVASLKDGLVGSAATSDDADHASAGRGDGLSHA